MKIYYYQYECIHRWKYWIFLHFFLSTCESYERRSFQFGPTTCLRTKTKHKGIWVMSLLWLNAFWNYLRDSQNTLCGGIVITDIQYLSMFDSSVHSTADYYNMYCFLCVLWLSDYLWDTVYLYLLLFPNLFRSAHANRSLISIVVQYLFVIWILTRIGRKNYKLVYKKINIIALYRLNIWYYSFKGSQICGWYTVSLKFEIQ